MGLPKCKEMQADYAYNPPEKCEAFTPDEGPCPVSLRLGHLLGLETVGGERGPAGQSTRVKAGSPYPTRPGPEPGSRSVSGPPSLLLGGRALEVTGRAGTDGPTASWGWRWDERAYRGDRKERVNIYRQIK